MPLKVPVIFGYQISLVEQMKKEAQEIVAGKILRGHFTAVNLQYLGTLIPSQTCKTWAFYLMHRELLRFTAKLPQFNRNPIRLNI